MDPSNVNPWTVACSGARCRNCMLANNATRCRSGKLANNATCVFGVCRDIFFLQMTCHIRQPRTRTYASTYLWELKTANEWCWCVPARAAGWLHGWMDDWLEIGDLAGRRGWYILERRGWWLCLCLGVMALGNLGWGGALLPSPVAAVGPATPSRDKSLQACERQLVSHTVGNQWSWWKPEL